MLSVVLCEVGVEGINVLELFQNALKHLLVRVGRVERVARKESSECDVTNAQLASEVYSAVQSGVHDLQESREMDFQVLFEGISLGTIGWREVNISAFGEDVVNSIHRGVD